MAHPHRSESPWQGVGVLLQDAVFGDREGAGLIKHPTVRVPAVKGSFETGGFILDNALPE
jgi:hypothetical protein